jgi:hypothetical protein
MQKVTEAIKEQELLPTIPIKFVIRGEVIESSDVVYTSRDGSMSFSSPSPIKYLDKIILRDPSSLINDFSGITVQEIIDFLVETGEALDFDKNTLMQEACEFTTPFSGLTPSIIESAYRSAPMFFTEPLIKAMVEGEVGIRYIDDWVEVPAFMGKARIRAYGAKTLHIIAGNVPLVGAITAIRGAVIKSDNIIKLPSNDPLTTTAILTTMRDLDRTHPVVKHVSAIYWKGGDIEFERRLINPYFIEKIVAWGGHNSIRHIKKLVGPGIDLITLDPKFSVSIIGEEAFRSEESIKNAAFLAAIDSAAMNQEACVTSRAHYVRTTPEKAKIYARYLYKFMQNQDPSLSTKPKNFPEDLKEEIDSLRYIDGLFDVVGGENGEGAVITSLAGEPVEFFPSCKTVNVVPIEDYEEAFDYISIATQTVGIYPESLKDKVMDQLVARGVQRFVSLGCAATNMNFGLPHDSIYPLKRSCKWISNEINEI